MNLQHRLYQREVEKHVEPVGIRVAKETRKLDVEEEGRGEEKLEGGRGEEKLEDNYFFVIHERFI